MPMISTRIEKWQKFVFLFVLDLKLETANNLLLYFLLQVIHPQDKCCNKNNKYFICIHFY